MSLRVMATRSVSLVTLGGMVVVYVARELPPGEKEDKSWRTKKIKNVFTLSGADVSSSPEGRNGADS